jgi:hypothetical protein
MTLLTYTKHWDKQQYVRLRKTRIQHGNWLRSDEAGGPCSMDTTKEYRLDAIQPPVSLAAAVLQNGAFAG